MRRLALLCLLAACAGPRDPRSEPAPAPPPSPARDAAAEIEPERPYVPDALRLSAIGSLTSLSPIEQALYAPGDFTPLRRPRPGEWLDAHPETGQPHDAFVARRYLRPDRKRRFLYLLPLGYPASPEDPDPSVLARFARDYFNVPVRLLPPAQPSSMEITSRRRSARRQLLAPDILDELARRIPGDGFLLIALTGEDLYPAPDWNFVFGQATLRKRVGVYSTARYHPAFYGSPARGADVGGVILQRTLKLMAHEIGHMFGLEHCVYYRCVMNGSNSILETDRSPRHLCPVCLRKLAGAARFDLVDRYRKLGRIYAELGLAEDAAWVRARARTGVD